MHSYSHIIKQAKQHKGILLIGALVLCGALVVIVQMTTGRDHAYTESSYAGGRDMMNTAEDGDYAVGGMNAIMDEAMPKSMMPPYMEGEAGYDAELDRQLVYTGSLSITVRDIEDTRAQVEEIVEEQGGFVSSEYFGENTYYNDYGNRQSAGYQGSMTLRVPSGVYEEVMGTLRDMALVIEYENSNVRDVTEQYYDVAARIENKQQEEAQYQAIMNRATEISDVLEVTRYLAEVRSEIEQLEGQRNRLSNQVELSTIELQISSEDTVRLPGSSWNPGNTFVQAWHSLVRSATGFVDWVITVLVFVPLILLYIGLLLGVYYIGMRVYHFVRARM